MTLSENDKIVSDQTVIFSIIFFVTVARDIGQNGKQYERDFLDHPSNQQYKTKVTAKFETLFLIVTEIQISKTISKLHMKKATGGENISAKLLKSCAPSYSHVYT